MNEHMNFENRFNGKIYSFFEKLYKIIVLNALWILFSTLGLVVFGIFPATYASFSTFYKLSKGEEDVSILRTYWTEYKKHFIKSSAIGYIYIVSGLIVLLNYEYFTTQVDGLFGTLGLYVSFVFALIMLLSFFYVYPVLVRRDDLSIRECIKFSIIIGISFPFRTVIILLIAAGLVALFSMLPQLSIFLGNSLLFFIIDKQIMVIFEKIENKIEENKKEA